MADPKPQHDKDDYGDFQIERKDVGETIDLDEAALRAQGHEVQLERSFSWMGALGLAFRCVDTFPHALLITNSFPIVWSTPG